MQYFKLFFVCFVLLQNAIWCRVYEECEDISEPDIIVGSKKSCTKYIVCDGRNSYEGECVMGYHFNDKTGSCDDPINANCDIEASDEVQSIFDENFSTTQSVLQTTKSETNTATVTNENEIEKNDLDENKMNSSIEESNTPICPPLRGFHNIKNIANPESCVAFYTCYNGHAIPMLCPSKMYFSENSGKCESQLTESCKAKYAVRLNCFKGVYDFVPHPTRCEYYFYCVNGYLMIMRCPNDFTWHFERGTCVHKSKSKCFSEKSASYLSNKDSRSQQF